MELRGERGFPSSDGSRKTSVSPLQLLVVPDGLCFHCYGYSPTYSLLPSLFLNYNTPSPVWAVHILIVVGPSTGEESAYQGPLLT